MQQFIFDINKVRFDERYENGLCETITLYFMGPKEWVNEDHPEAVMSELCVELPIQYQKAVYANVMISPVRLKEDDSLEDYDWNEVAILPTEIEELMHLAENTLLAREEVPVEECLEPDQKL